MPDPTIFETRLADAFDRYVAPAPTTVDARALAHAAAAGALRVGRGPAVRSRRLGGFRLVFVLAVLALAAALVIIAAGSLRRTAPGPLGGGGRIFAWLGTGTTAGSGVLVTPDGVATLVGAQETRGGACPTLIADGSATAAFGFGGIVITSIDGRYPSGSIATDYAGFERWSPDGRQVALVDMDNAVTIATLAPDGTATRRQFAIAGISWAGWSDDSTKLAVAILRNGAVSVQVIDAIHGQVAGAPTITLPTGASGSAGVVLGVRWAQDGRRVAVMVETPDAGDTVADTLVTADVEGGSVVAPRAFPLIRPGGRPVTRLGGWSPDGLQLLVSTDDSLLAVDTRAGTSSIVARGLAQGRLDPRWSLDGLAIAYADGSDLVLTSRDGRVQRRSTLPGTGEVAWSPDGQVLAVLGTASGAAASGAAASDVAGDIAVWLYRPWEDSPRTLLARFASTPVPGQANRPPCLTWQPESTP